MIKRRGFSLMELMVATLIFGFIAVSLATLYSTANRHVFQNYRSNTVKGNVSLGIRAIRNVMAQANRIDAPAYDNTGTRLAVGVNVNSDNCYPITNLAPAATWHLFCTINTGGNIQLYYHTGAYPAPPACVAVNPANNVNCGAAGGVMLTQHLNTNIPNIFSRLRGDVLGSRLLVRVNLNSIWNATGVNSTQRAVDYYLDSTFSVNAAGS
jgi:prepilin-type N-terminal cleavage/methylation domain-containing protein